MNVRLPYRDDTFDEDEAYEAAPVEEVLVEAPVVGLAEARLVAAEEARAQAAAWCRRATSSNRDVRRKHLEAMTTAALEAAVALHQAQTRGAAQ